MMEWLLPIKTGKTFIDVNTIFHLAFWVWMGSNFWYLKMDIYKSMFIGILLSFAWEFVERYAEKTWPEILMNPESSLNAYVSDPLTCVIGILFSWYALNNWSV